MRISDPVRPSPERLLKQAQAMPSPHVLPTLLTRRKSFPRSIAAAASQSSSSDLTQSGTVRTWPPLGLTVVPIGGWTDSVYVSCQMTPSVPGGCTDLGSFPPGVSSVTFFATNMPVGNYSVTFFGTADGVTRSAPA